MTPQQSIPSAIPEVTPTFEEQAEVLPLLSRVAWFAAIAYSAIALIIGLADIIFILRHHTVYPFGDHWIWLARLAEGNLSTALLTQYNEHRLFFPGLLYWTDLRWFGGRNAFLICASVLINLAGIVLLALPFIRLRELPLSVRMIFLGFVTILMLWYVQGPNFFYAFSLCLALANVGILSSLYLFTVFYEYETLRNPRANWVLAAAILCGFVGTFSYGHGILIWPLLIVNAVILQLRPRYTVAIAAATVLALGLYFWHYVTPASHSSPLEGLRDPLKLALYFFLMIGLPLLGGENSPQGWRMNVLPYGVIMIGLAIAASLLGIYIFRRSKSKHAIFYSSVLMLAIGSVTITALGRSKFPVSQSLSGRYAPIPLLFWISLIALITVYLGRFEAPGGLGRGFWCVILAGVSFATLPTQFIMGGYLAGRERSQDAAVESIAMGIPDPATVTVELHHSFALVTRVDHTLMQKLHRPSFFQLPESGFLMTPLQSHFRITGTCESAVDDVRLYKGGQSSGVHLFGWLFDKSRGASPGTILVTDQAGTIIGLGLGDVPRPDVAATFQNSAMGESGWIAYAQLPADGSKQLRVFGDFAGSSAVCEVVSPKTLVPQ